ncbi:hypothetical protein HU200_055659 [Digitaria exilis]|uniref:Uncharacterized protein n=1 Tax=Digitaria exilis TaxID=1010633 RepID=A0A835ANE5_9POAL|nr:hypothetical protein HU200_055659 [Digitaria exilis]
MASDAGGGGGGDNEPHHVGFIVAKIVDMGHYDSKIAGREAVRLVREPSNPLDGNFIAVYNSRGEKVGNIQKTVVAVLSPLIDSQLLDRVEGIVPKDKYDAAQGRPCQVHLFARPASLPTVLAALKNGGLDLLGAERPETKWKSDRNVDNLFSLVGNARGKSQIPPMEAPGDVVKSELLDHQKEALGWLVHHEESDGMPPFWEERQEGGFRNVLSNESMEERPPPLKGGIFADAMGLGKTLTLLALIERTKTRHGDAEKPNQVKRPRVTLVVCPVSAFSAWLDQINEHIKPGSLNWYLYHGERTKDKNELLKNDLVLTTYTTLATEFDKQDSPMKEVDWFRVILDEAHVIKNPETKQTKAVIALNTERRWVVTGTPIQNNLFDLHPFMVFLRFHPFTTKSSWQRLIQGHKNGLSRLQNLLAAVSLRRTKDMETGSKRVNLPPKSVTEYYVHLSAEERGYYDQIEHEGRMKMKEFGDNDSILRNYSTMLYFVLRLRQLCNDVALCPLDRKLWLPAHPLEGWNIMQILSKEDLFLAPEVKDPDEDGSSNLCSSMPVSLLRKMLLLLEKPLEAEGFKILRLDGSMTLKKRLETIQQFANDGPDSPTVLLASLKAAGAGVNLTTASTVYLFDPWWNPGVEEQAMDRVHRIGQKKDVKVVRLIVKGSIEERILSLQERKKGLFANAFGKKGGKDNRDVRLEELQTMLGLNAALDV